MTALLMHWVSFDEQEFIKQELFQLEKELIAECLDVANTWERTPSSWVDDGFSGYHSGLCPRPFSVISLPMRVMCNHLGGRSKTWSSFPAAGGIHRENMTQCRTWT